MYQLSHCLFSAFLMGANQQTSTGCSKLVILGGMISNSMWFVRQNCFTFSVKCHLAESISISTLLKLLRVMYDKIILRRYFIISSSNVLEDLYSVSISVNSSIAGIRVTLGTIAKTGNLAPSAEAVNVADRRVFSFPVVVAFTLLDPTLAYVYDLGASRYIADSSMLST